MAKKKLLIAAFVVGIFAAVLVWLYVDQKVGQSEKVMKDTRTVAHAAVEIPAGTPLTQDKLRTKKVPVQFLPANPLLKEDIQIYLDTRLGSQVNEGDMILTSHFATEQISNDLSGKIPDKERAMSVPVNEVSGVSGLLRPGDRVDILGTFPISSEDEVIPEAGGGKSVGYVTMTLLQNVTLLAVGKEISGVRNGQSSRHSGYNTVTASVTIDEAELLTIAQTRGNLTLLLRREDDVDIGSVKRKTLRQVLEDLEVLNRERKTRVIKQAREEPEEPQIEIIRGSD
ncbi:MAG: Flp pilus assembly protein CpaB [Myxococcota bacterium]